MRKYLLIKNNFFKLNSFDKKAIHLPIPANKAFSNNNNYNFLNGNFNSSKPIDKKGISALARFDILKNSNFSISKNNNNQSNSKNLMLSKSIRKSGFCEAFKDKEDYIYIISIRGKTLKNIRKESHPTINHYFDISKFTNLSLHDLKEVEQTYMKLEKEDKIANTLKVCHIFVKKNYYSKHLIDYFIDNCGEIAEDSLFNLNSFLFYINGLDLKPNQINFNPNFFKIIEENFFKEGVLMDLMDMKVYTRFFYRFKNSFSQKLINYAERCLIYLLENLNSYTIINLYQVNEIVKYCFISGSDRCFQKIIDYYTKMILVKSANFSEAVEFLKVITLLTGKSLKQENIVNYEIKYEILIRGFDKIKGKIYEYITKEKVEISFLKNLLHVMIHNTSIGYFKGINLKDIIVNYILKNENEIGPDQLRGLLRLMCWSRAFLARYQNEINQLILSNLSELESGNSVSMNILFNYLRNSNDPNPEIRELTELLIIKSLIIKNKESVNSFPSSYFTHKYFYNELLKKNISSFLGYCFIEAHGDIVKRLAKIENENLTNNSNNENSFYNKRKNKPSNTDANTAQNNINQPENNPDEEEN